MPGSRNAPDPLDVVNRSGYPLQIALAHEVQRNTRAHGWRVLYQEHSWQHRVDEAEGFIDLALEHDRMQVVLVLECKRVADGTWIFLPEDGNSTPRRYARAHCISRSTQPREHVAWAEFPFSPRSPQTAFCVMPKSARDPTVDSLAAELVSATEALAEEEIETYLRSPERKGSFRRVYFPVIVTTAQLSVCSFDPANISLETGTLPASSQLEPAQFVRYTKQLSTRRVSVSNISYYREAEALSSAKSRTAIIIVASELDAFLRAFQVDDRAK